MSLSSRDNAIPTGTPNPLPGVPLIESPLFEASVASMGLSNLERDVAQQLHERGYAVIDFPDPDFAARADRIRASLQPRFPVDFDDPNSIKNVGDMRMQDAWRFDDDVRAIATHSEILDLLSKLYGRRAFPFQTLNFPVGTQQHPHTDIVHFSSQPERFMCGVWVALEDIHSDAGPLLYYPGSHKWPIISNAMIGRDGWQSQAHSAQAPFETVWGAMVDAQGARQETFLARKGQALIWAANLLHGGSSQVDRCRTRWSQVTHYYFSDCIYYTPAFSNEHMGQLDLRTVRNIATGEIEPNMMMGRPIDETDTPRRSKKPKLLDWLGNPKSKKIRLPKNFDPRTYYALNPDVEAAGEDAASHYIKHGKNEGRRFQ